MTDVALNLSQIRTQVAATARGCGRDPDEITLIAVSKTRSVEEITSAVIAGALDFGENYVQEMQSKAEALAGLQASPRWHFIGHLQRNKVKYLTSFCTLIHSVDNPSLAEEINRRALAASHTQPVLLQVDLAGEATKTGCPETELGKLVEVVNGLPGLAWQGLMTIPPLAEDPEASRPYYRRLVALRAELLASGIPGEQLRHLSMGMSNDYKVAIEEGATLVRVGTAIFGPRK